jgi:hypothetical protein
LAPQQLSQAAPGGTRRAVARHTFADKSHSQLLVTRGAALTHAPPSSSTSSSGGAALQDSDQATGSSSSSSTSSSGGLPFYLVPRLEPFSRISGICTIVGDRETPSREKHALAVGDFVRVGSVGLVVTEARVSPNAAAVSITAEQLWHLKPRAFAAVAPPEPGSAHERRMGAAMISPSKQPKPLGEATGEATGEAKDEAKGEDRGEAKGEATGEATAVGLPGGLPGRRTRRQASGGRRGGGRSVGPCPGSRGEGKEGEEGEGEEEADDSGVDSGHWATESDAEEATVAAGSVATSVGKAYLGSSSGGGYGYGSRAAQTPVGDDEDPPLCYVCCDDAEVGPSNPLVSACACTGGTRWLHLACLDRLLSGGSGPDDAHAAPCVMFRNQNRNFVCKVCRSEYRTHCELLGSWNPDGSGPVVVPIPQPSLRPPYLCFKVVTHNAHNAFADSIFNSTFHVSFAGLVDPAALQAAAAEGAAGGSAVGLPAARRSLVIGRSLE